MTLSVLPSSVCWSVCHNFLKGKFHLFYARIGGLFIIYLSSIYHQFNKYIYLIHKSLSDQQPPSTYTLLQLLGSYNPYEPISGKEYGSPVINLFFPSNLSGWRSHSLSVDRRAGPGQRGHSRLLGQHAHQRLQGRPSVQIDRQTDRQIDRQTDRQF